MFEMKLVCVIIVLLLSIIEISKSNLVWLISCRDNNNCSYLKNATCLNHFCYCGKEFYVCEKLNIIGQDCDNSEKCNLSYSECGKEGKCVCKDGFVPANDFSSCLRGNEKSPSQSISVPRSAYLFISFVILIEIIK
ncbi:uncharacterized protein LOC123016270 [Tribolium madens]|uniref:uncharacterized protein LOC123016270 n=1 Tax=Tribolium madens TaxID=41895 RepID=UPI001CF75837|nr:uncharacterized protein LOC123016270 [Tribolium madens]